MAERIRFLFTFICVTSSLMPLSSSSTTDFKTLGSSISLSLTLTQACIDGLMMCYHLNKKGIRETEVNKWWRRLKEERKRWLPLTREYTINLYKYLHGWFLKDFACGLGFLQGSLKRG
ncbi:hypothetical protein L6452_09528 [Arctium lappa]|uniref:Uncharacterized protein n=1 Tax=Arctium lappa TaxID=4217 RepID=A0ACB9DK93_ARCLA|nr:hypothetical protein L6452_09528 [Arctium lappa]